jgi:hypothetical protein
LVNATVPSYYEEVVEGESLFRHEPGMRHELVRSRLHAAVAASLQSVLIARLLPPREPVQWNAGTILRPDLTLVTKATGKPWLIAEVVDASDHRADTVVKKSLYEELKLPRLWMVDIRYDNLEVYHQSPYGLSLARMLAGKDTLTENLLPSLHLAVGELFKS